MWHRCENRMKSQCSIYLPFKRRNEIDNYDIFECQAISIKLVVSRVFHMHPSENDNTKFTCHLNNLMTCVFIAQNTKAWKNIRAQTGEGLRTMQEKTP